MEGDGDDEIDVTEMRRGGQATAEKGTVKSTHGEIVVVFQGARDVPIGSFVVHQSRRIGVVHGLGAPMTFQDSVEAVGERIMGLEPEAGVRHIGRAGEAQVPLAKAQGTAAHHAGAGQEQVAEGAKDVDDSTHIVRVWAHSHPGWGPKGRPRKTKTTQAVDNLCCFSRKIMRFLRSTAAQNRAQCLTLRRYTCAARE